MLLRPALALLLAAAVAPVTATQDAQAAFAKRAPHPALLFRPLPSATLELGSTTELHFRDGETTATAVQAVLSNATFALPLPSFGSAIIPFLRFEARVNVSLPGTGDLSPGTYRLSVFENSGADANDFSNGGAVASVDVHIVDPTPLLRVQARKRDVAGRADHPAGIDQPTDGATLTAGQSFHLSMHDGETTADTIQIVLRSADGSNSYNLGTAPFTSYASQADVTVPSDAASGSYTLEVQENASYDEGTFTDAYSVNVDVQSSGGGSSQSSPSSSFASDSSSDAPSSSSSQSHSALFSAYSAHTPSSSSSSQASSSKAQSSSTPSSSLLASTSSMTAPPSTLTVSQLAQSSAPAPSPTTTSVDSAASACRATTLLLVLGAVAGCRAVISELL